MKNRLATSVIVALVCAIASLGMVPSARADNESDTPDSPRPTVTVSASVSTGEGEKSGTSASSTDSVTSAEQQKIEAEAESAKQQQEAALEKKQKEAEAAQAAAEKATEQAKQTLENQTKQLQNEAAQAAAAKTEVEQLLTAIEQIKAALQSTGATQSITIQSSPTQNSVQLKQSNGTTNQVSFQLPTTMPTSGLASFTAPSTGQVTIFAQSNGQLAIDNGGVKTVTSLPIVIDPTSKTMAIVVGGASAKIAAPGQVVSSLEKTKHLTVINSVVLGRASSQPPVYDISGEQTVRLFGFLPARTVKTEVVADATTGSVVTVSEPWYLHYLGFLFARSSTTPQVEGSAQTI